MAEGSSSEITNIKNEDTNRKPKMESTSSVSDVSIQECEKDNTQKINQKKAEKKKKKKKKVNSDEKDEKDESLSEVSADEPNTLEGVQSQLREISNKLNNVLRKDDAFLKETMKEVVKEMKDELLKSVIGRIEKQESALFDKKEENDDKLRKEIDTLKTDLANTKSEKVQMEKENKTAKLDIEAKLNEMEQYGRRNNLRISGLADKENETAEESVDSVIETLNKNIPNLLITKTDKDIAHRVGKINKDKKRQIIVKFQSRMKRNQVMSERRAFRGKNLYKRRPYKDQPRGVQMCPFEEERYSSVGMDLGKEN